MNDSSMLFDNGNVPNPSQVQSIFLMESSSYSKSIASSYSTNDKIKIEYQGEFRQITKITEYRKLTNIAMQRFQEIGIAVRSLQNPDFDELFKLTYNDSDHDVISISSDADLQEAIDQAVQGQTLKIYISAKKPLPQVSEFEKINSSKQSQIVEEEVKVAPIVNKDGDGNSSDKNQVDNLCDDNRIRQIVKEEMKVLGSEIVQGVIQQKLIELQMLRQNRKQKEQLVRNIEKFKLNLIGQQYDVLCIAGQKLKYYWHLENQSQFELHQNLLNLRPINSDIQIVQVNIPAKIIKQGERFKITIECIQNQVGKQKVQFQLEYSGSITNEKLSMDIDVQHPVEPSDLEMKIMLQLHEEQMINIDVDSKRILKKIRSIEQPSYEKVLQSILEDFAA